MKADDKSKAYGAALPTLTASYAGFVNGDNVGSLTTAPVLSTTATAEVARVRLRVAAARGFADAKGRFL